MKMERTFKKNWFTFPVFVILLPTLQLVWAAGWVGGSRLAFYGSSEGCWCCRDRRNPWHLRALCGQEEDLPMFYVGLESSPSGQRLLARGRTWASRSDRRETWWVDGGLGPSTQDMVGGVFLTVKAGCVCLRHDLFGLNVTQILKHELNSQNEALESAYVPALAGAMLQNLSSSSITNPSNCILFFCSILFDMCKYRIWPQTCVGIASNGVKRYKDEGKLVPIAWCWVPRKLWLKFALSPYCKGTGSMSFAIRRVICVF